VHVQFAELPVADQDRALSFYTEHLGWQAAADVPMGKDGWRWVELSHPGAQTHLHFVRKSPDASDDPVLVLIVPDIDATVEAMRAGGVEILSGPQPAPYAPDTITAEFRDSEGNRMMLSAAGV